MCCYLNQAHSNAKPEPNNKPLPDCNDCDLFDCDAALPLRKAAIGATGGTLQVCRLSLIAGHCPQHDGAHCPEHGSMRPTVDQRLAMSLCLQESGGMAVAEKSLAGESVLQEHPAELKDCIK